MNKLLVVEYRLVNRVRFTMYKKANLNLSKKSQGSPGQAVLLILLTLSILSTNYSAFASDDLLDPEKIGTKKNPLELDGMLDPAQLGSSSRSTGASASLRSTHYQAPGYARGMAGSVISGLDSLTTAAAQLINEILDLDSRAREMESKISTLKDEKEQKLGEYRSGLFCSGCNKTKSEILASGSTFPHPGRRVIRPTPEQIEAKDRELQAPIDQLERDLQANRARRIKALHERDEALLQIGYGLNLWRTSISFERSLIELNEKERRSAYETERSKVEQQIGKIGDEILQKETAVAHIPALTFEISKFSTKLKQLDDDADVNKSDLELAKAKIGALNLDKEKNKDKAKYAGILTEIAKLQEKLKGYVAKDSLLKGERVKVIAQLEQMKADLQKADNAKAKLASLTKEREMWSATLDQLEARRGKEKLSYQNELARANVAVNHDHDTLEGFLKKGKLWSVTTAAVNSSAIYPSAGFDAMGGMFLMGSYDYNRHDETLPSVEKFIVEFKKSYRLGPQGNSGMNGDLPDSDVPVIDQSKAKLRELLKCNPDKGEKCTSKPMGNPGGVRN